MPTDPAPTPRRSYLATIDVKDVTTLGYQRIFLPEQRRQELEKLEDIRIVVNGDIWVAAAERHAVRVITDKIAAIIGVRGLAVEVDLAAGIGWVRYTPLFGEQGLLATVTVQSTDVLAEVTA